MFLALNRGRFNTLGSKSMIWRWQTAERLNPRATRGDSELERTGRDTHSPSRSRGTTRPWTPGRPGRSRRSWRRAGCKPRTCPGWWRPARPGPGTGRRWCRAWRTSSLWSPCSWPPGSCPALQTQNGGTKQLALASEQAAAQTQQQKKKSGGNVCGRVQRPERRLLSYCVDAKHLLVCSGAKYRIGSVCVFPELIRRIQ